MLLMIELNLGESVAADTVEYVGKWGAEELRCVSGTLSQVPRWLFTRFR